jgi:hypothetical protein
MQKPGALTMGRTPLRMTTRNNRKPQRACGGTGTYRGTPSGAFRRSLSLLLQLFVAREYSVSTPSSTPLAPRQYSDDPRRCTRRPCRLSGMLRAWSNVANPILGTVTNRKNRNEPPNAITAAASLRVVRARAHARARVCAFVRVRYMRTLWT